MINNVLTILIFVFSASLFSLARQEDTVPQLMAKADAASAGQQADLCMEVAEREVKVAVEAFKANKIDEGRDSLQQIVKYADKGHSAAMQSGKRLKHTEIKLRQVALRLRDLKSNLEVDDQPLAQATVDKLENFRTEILKSMFGSKKND
jgi:predicted HTH domain antitoxin